MKQSRLSLPHDGLLRSARNDGSGCSATRYFRDADAKTEKPRIGVAICNRLARRNISLLAKAAPTGQKKAGNKKRQRRTI
jgi:hypothetical protein